MSIATVLALFVSLLLNLVLGSYNESVNSTVSRRLASVERDEKKHRIKASRLAKLIDTIDVLPTPTDFKPDADSPGHNPDGPAVFTSAMGMFMKYDAMNYCLYGISNCFCIDLMR